MQKRFLHPAVLAVGCDIFHFGHEFGIEFPYLPPLRVEQMGAFGHELPVFVYVLVHRVLMEVAPYHIIIILVRDVVRIPCHQDMGCRIEQQLYAVRIPDAGFLHFPEVSGSFQICGMQQSDCLFCPALYLFNEFPERHHIVRIRQGGKAYGIQVFRSRRHTSFHPESPSEIVSVEFYYRLAAVFHVYQFPVFAVEYFCIYRIGFRQFADCFPEAVGSDFIHFIAADYGQTSV